MSVLCPIALNSFGLSGFGQKKATSDAGQPAAQDAAQDSRVPTRTRKADGRAPVVSQLCELFILRFSTTTAKHYYKQP